MENFSPDAGPGPRDAPGLTNHYMSRLAAYRQHDVERDNMIQELIRRTEELERAYYEKCDDYDNEVESRRMWQAKATKLTKEIGALTQVMDSNPFVYAIIDGDGAVFDQALLAKGADGGAEAAHMLQTEIKNYIKEVYPEANIEDWSIVVQVVLNVEGLAKKLHAAGIVPNTAEQPTLAAFGRAFGRTQPLFSFVDVGSGKESADHKIRELMRLMVRVNQCKHIFFGPCHDNGYLPVLEPYKRDPNVAPRLTLLETTPAQPGFHQLGFKTVNFPAIFRSDPLPARPAMQPLPPPAPLVPAPSPVQTKVPGPRIANMAAASAISSPNLGNLRVSSPPAQGSSGSWSAVSKPVVSSGQVIDIGSTKKSHRKYYLLNADSERIDEPLPRTDAAAERKFKEMMAENGNYCNKYYLLGGCNSDLCGYYHGEKLSPQLLLVLRHKVRGSVCPQKDNCDDPDCVYGHHCKWASDCTLPWCRFDFSHNMDLVARLRVFEDGSTQLLKTRSAAA
ncbi:hypothetical protein ACHAQH_008101 [Verticillium albo-atrum]